MNKTEKVILSLIAIGMFVSVVMFINLIQLFGANVMGGMSQSSGRFSSLENTGTSTSVLLTTSGAQMVATSSAREYVEIANLTAAAIYCNADNDKPAVMYKGILIAASSTKVFGQDFAYTGGIRCVSSANASTTVYAKQ